MLDKTPEGGNKKYKNILVVQPNLHGKRRMLHSLLALYLNIEKHEKHEFCVKICQI